ncbi:MAG: redox-sensing transcriptional repressor Rex [Lachnospiraceae bacterium]|nr:redox-sensing transcriptional repressor Rex [Lachnospiraceae bacterium]
MSDRKISQAVISRLPRYLRYLGDLKDEGVERISSHDLSLRMHVTASQIRQDFNHFGGFGQQGYGYNVDYLYEEIANILGLNHKHTLVIIGAGNLGQALANYMNFERRGFIILGLFDKNPNLIGKSVRNMEIMDIREAPDFIRKNEIEIAVLTLPKAGATEISRQLVDSGIRAIWNFAHVDLELPDSIVVENVHLSESLMKLSYKISQESGEEI